MLKNYLLLAFNNFRKQKMFSLINILGLTVGITCCLMIFLFILNELSYDSFHKNAGSMYRVMRVGNVNGKRSEIPYLSPPYATALVNDFPDAVQEAVRISPDNDLISYGNISFNEKRIYLADDNFFTFFSFPLLQGNAATVLKEPNSIVLTAKTAKKYFGTADPIGKVLTMNQKMALKVTGIAQDVPVNSHLDFDMVIPISNFKHDAWFNQWPSNSLFTYVQLKPGVSAAALNKRFPAFMDKYLGAFYKESGFKMDLQLNPFKEIYFEKETPFDNVKHGDKKMVYIFMSIALLILLIACINFMNLATARAAERAKEVGLRKVMGAVRQQLIGQFIFESLLVTLLASLLSVFLLQLLMPAYTQLLGYQLPGFLGNPRLYAFLAAVVIVVGLLAGSYPALLLSSFSPIEALKGKLRLGKNGAFFRKTLVVFQFGISVLLIIGITIIMSQMNYMKNSNLGFDKEQSLIVRFDNASIRDNRLSFKNELKRNSAVQQVSLMSGEPGGFHDSYGFEYEGKPGERLLLNTEFTDFDYVKTLGLSIIAGRDFSGSFPTDSAKAVLINHSAATRMGYTPDQAVGKWVKNLVSDTARRYIVGVVEDFHYMSLKEPIGGLVITPGPDLRLALVKMKTRELQATLNDFKRIYTQLVPAYPFEYSFLDEKFNQLYKTELRQKSVLTAFSVIAICIACLGLFGLASYTAVKRTKEIGVRKVLGSSVQDIVVLLSKDLLKPVLLGTLIALPLGYYFTAKWLQGFAYRVPLHWWMFAGAAAMAILIALFTVSVQAIKAALANPVKSLRTE
ncbi:MAG TPA: ABC transporter permease [Chitinophagaceae bacterium]|nr:ABC transporter permease [Chitinophagaceae bacterium]